MMNSTSEQFNIFLAYPTHRTDEDNFYRVTKTYINIGTQIKAYLIDWEKMDGLPKCDIYVPAEHEKFIHCAYTNGLLSEVHIIATNCEIINGCDLLILFGGFKLKDNAVIQEVVYAREKGVAIYTMPDLSPTAINALKFAIICILKSGE